MLENKQKEKIRTKFNKQKRAMKVFTHFMTDLPQKPVDAIKLHQWKGERAVCIKDGMDKFQAFMLKHLLKKGTRKTKLRLPY